jgi:hypothetical protein
MRNQLAAELAEENREEFFSAFSAFSMWLNID